MLEIAFQNQRQHRQLRHAGGPLRLARSDRGASLWQAVGESAATQSDAVVEISFDADGIALAAAGCEIETEGDCKGRAAIDRRPVLPVRFVIGDTWLEIVDAATRAAAPRRILERLHSADRGSLQAAARTSPRSTRAGLSSETLASWFVLLGSLNRWSNSLQELFVQAARAAVESIGLDGAIILRRRDGEWDISASYLPRPELGILCDPTVLGELVETPETLFHGTADSSATEVTDSQGRVPAVVVSPLRNRDGELSGAIYGYRSVREGNSRRRIRCLEANLIELLAGAVSEGMTRLEHEAAVDRRRVLLEQAFATEGAQHARQLVSEQREVTLLFADLRDFSRLSAVLETEQVFELLSQVMDTLTAAVMEHDGLVVDYYGDGLVAIWNAPADQAEHRELACRAALRMLNRLPAIGADWAELLGARLRLGVGIHTGAVQVGNAGSSQRLKYGPRGANVHLASRVEAATKLVGVPLLVTDAVASHLSGRLHVFRVCRAKMTGVHRPVDLYSIVSLTADSSTIKEAAAYETSLRLFENGRLEQAAFELSKIEPGSPVPADFLRERIERALGRREQRRSTDKSARVSNGVIELLVK